MFSVLCACVCVFWTPSHRNFIFGMKTCISLPYLGRIWVSRSLDHGQGQEYMQKWLFTCFDLLFHCVWLQVINKIKVTYQGQSQIKVTSKETYSYTGGCIWLKCVLVFKNVLPRNNCFGKSLKLFWIVTWSCTPCMEKWTLDLQLYNCWLLRVILVVKVPYTCNQMLWSYGDSNYGPNLPQRKPSGAICIRIRSGFFMEYRSVANSIDSNSLYLGDLVLVHGSCASRSLLIIKKSNIIVSELQ